MPETGAAKLFDMRQNIEVEGLIIGTVGGE